MIESPQDHDGWIAETNMWGGIKYYRWVNGVKEYEPETITSHGKMTRSQLDAFNESEKRKQTPIIRPTKPTRACPFKSGINTLCIGSKCAFYFDEGCKLAQTGRNPAKDTKGLLCPINAVKTECGANCALYDGGCRLISLLTEREEING